jgi:hypothetical protein
LKVKEVQKPWVSGGIFCILFAAVGKKYAAGDNKRKLPAGGNRGEIKSLVRSLPHNK